MSQEQPSQTGITTQDMMLVLQVIQAATARGAIKPEELSIVGGLYDRICKFLNSVGVQQNTDTGEGDGPTINKGEK